MPILAVAQPSMRTSVKSAWPAFCKQYEGRLSTMYLDTKGLVTTGTGNLIDSVAAAQALPWLTKTGARATPAQIEAEWKQIKARQSIRSQGGYAYIKYATLHLDDATIDSLLFKVTASFWARLGQTLPNLATYPADAQLALLDLSWQNGAGFLDLKSGGKYVWAGTRAALLAEDWSAAASHVPGAGSRADRRKRLFTNAGTVARLGLDRDVLWDQTTPVKTTPPAPTPPPATTPPKEADVPVNFRGGRTCTCVATSLPLVEQDMIRRGLIKRSIDVYQLGYRNDVSASAGTHAGGGNTDVAQFSDAQIQVWREWGWTIQHRTTAQGFDMDHGHGWPLGCTHLSSGGRVQAAQWGKRQNGLASKGRIAGKWPIDDWQTAMKKQVARMAEDKQKELELPTTSEVAKALASDQTFLNAVAKAVLDYDYVPNAGVLTSNADNENVATRTALTQLGKKSNSIEAKLDALIARFPGGTTPPA